MPSPNFSRRSIIKLAGGAAMTAFLPAAARAAEEWRIGPLKISDTPLPEFLGGMVADVLKLERDADRLRLPRSKLPRGEKIDLDPMALIESDSLYRVLMPRLVTLIDRSERINPGFADQAGGLLARLHAGEHEVPPWLKLVPPGRDADPLMMAEVADGPDIAPIGSAREGSGVFADGAPPPPPLPPPVPSPPTAAPAPIVTPPTEPIPLSRARNYPALREEYRRLFDTAVARDAFADSLNWHLAMVRGARARYEKVEVQTGVPWHVIAVIHALEASFNFRAHLHNGDFPLTQRTRQVPAGRPATWLPPSDWEASAKDALRLLGFTRETDWSVERTLYRLESYNGFGYRNVGIASPYLWSFSNHYEAGKFVSDGSFSARARSQQCGTAVMLKSLASAGDIAFPV